MMRYRNKYSGFSGSVSHAWVTSSFSVPLIRVKLYLICDSNRSYFTAFAKVTGHSSPLLRWRGGPQTQWRRLLQRSRFVCPDPPGWGHNCIPCRQTGLLKSARVELVQLAPPGVTSLPRCPIGLPRHLPLRYPLLITTIGLKGQKPLPDRSDFLVC